MTEPLVLPATAADRDRAVDTIVAAFAADPAFRYFFPDPATFDAQARVFAGHLFDRRVVRDSVWVAGGGGAVALWERPGPGGDGRPDLPRDTLDRLAAFDRAVHAALPGTPHWYLGVLATHPRHAGQRWGREVMAPGLAAAAAEGLPAYLETATSINVAMYRRAGFEVTDELSAAGLPVWVMVRRP